MRITPFSSFASFQSSPLFSCIFLFVSPPLLIFLHISSYFILFFSLKMGHLDVFQKVGQKGPRRARRACPHVVSASFSFWENQKEGKGPLVKNETWTADAKKFTMFYFSILPREGRPGGVSLGARCKTRRIHSHSRSSGELPHPTRHKVAQVWRLLASSYSLAVAILVDEQLLSSFL